MIKSIPLNKLVQSPRNVRRHSDPAADAELKASIGAHGLLQNLIVRPAAKGKFEVEAGERRRRAMLALADEKILARDHEVTCLVLEDSAEAAVKALTRTAGFLRSELGHRLNLYSPPQLHFAYDDSIESGMRMSQLIDEAIAADRKLSEP